MNFDALTLRFEIEVMSKISTLKFIEIFKITLHNKSPQ